MSAIRVKANTITCQKIYLKCWVGIYSDVTTKAFYSLRRITLIVNCDLIEHYSVRTNKDSVLGFRLMKRRSFRHFEWFFQVGLQRGNELSSHQITSLNSDEVVAEWLRALDLKPGGPWFKSSTLLLSGFVLGCTAVIPRSTPRPRCVKKTGLTASPQVG